MNSSLPQDVLIEIFSRAHTKSIGACRCLSKSWKTYLSSQEFIKFHLTRRTAAQENFLLTLDASVYLIPPPVSHILSENFEFPVSTDFKKFGLRSSSWRNEVVGSCNGLVLFLSHVVNYDKKLFFAVNPITRQVVRIPDPPLTLTEPVVKRGFGYDSSIDEHKIIAHCYNSTYDPKSYITESYITVYSLKTGLWKKPLISPYYYHHLRIGPCLDGDIICLAKCRGSDNQTVIAAFNLSTEVFTEISPPPNLDMYSRPYVVGGYLCMMTIKRETISMTSELWIMKVYGLGESWTKLRVEPFGDWNNNEIHPLCFIENEEVIVAKRANGLFLYNLNNGTTNGLAIDETYVDSYLDGCTFVDTLISPCYQNPSNAAA